MGWASTAVVLLSDLVVKVRCMVLLSDLVKVHCMVLLSDLVVKVRCIGGCEECGAGLWGVPEMALGAAAGCLISTICTPLGGMCEWQGAC